MVAAQVRWLLVAPGYWLLRLLHRLLGKQLLMACEVAMEYLLALTHSPQVENEALTSKCWKSLLYAPLFEACLCRLAFGA